MSAPQFAILGPLEVVRSDGGKLSLGGPKQRELLGLLILHRHRPVPASRLITELWGDNPPRGAEVTLRSHVSHLRRPLAAAAGDGLLITGPAGYSLALTTGQVDADRFEHLIGLGQEALVLDRPQRAVEHIRDAMRLWRGQPYAELADVEAAQAEAARLEEVRLSALEVLAAAELAAGRSREVVAELESLIHAHPFRERLWAHLMVALYRSGRQAEALDAYGRARKLLADELGLDPGPELQALAQSVLRQDTVLLGNAEPSRSGETTARTTARRPPDALLTAAARTTLVGRRAEMARLDAAWESVTRGEGRVLLISGEAGIGKTRLVAELVQRAQVTEGSVLVGRCDAAALPYRPLAEALSNSDDALDLLGNAPAAVHGELARLLNDSKEATSADGVGAAQARDERALYAAVAFVLGQVASGGPVLFIIDNAERIDQATALLLRHLMERLPEKLLIVLCFRDPPGGRHPPLLGLLGDAAVRDVVERISLGPLSEPEVADLVRDLLPSVDGVVNRFWRHTGGNPFFATEMATALTGSDPAAVSHSWDVPVGVRDVLRHRLLSLSDQARQILPVAAVLGPEVDFELLALVAHLSEDEVAQALDEAVAAGLLVESGRSWASSYAFPHELMRDALQSQVKGLRLRTLHVAAADALISRPRLARGGNGAIAMHFRAAGAAADPEEAARYSRLAAEEAQALYAWDEAIEHAEFAAECLASAGPAKDYIDAALAAAMLRLKSSRGIPEAVSLLESVLRRSVETGDDVTAGLIHSRLGSALSGNHSALDIPRALEHFAAAERLLSEPERVFHLQRGRSQAAMYGMRTAELAQASGHAHSIAAELGRRDLEVVARWGQGWAALNQGRPADATAIWERGWEIAHQIADPFLGWMPVNAAALACTAYLLHPSAARSWCRRGLGQPRFDSFLSPHGAVVDQLGLCLASMGELAAAHEAVETLPADAVTRRMLIFLDGHWEQAEMEWAAAVAADESRGDLHDAALNLRWLATARLTLGDHDGGVAVLERALELSCAGPQLPGELDTRAELARLLATDRLIQAEQHLARCEEILSAGQDWYGVIGQVELARAAVAAASGDKQVADAAFARAVETFTTFRLPWRAADALALWGRSDQAAAIYADLGAAERWPKRVQTR